MAVRLTLWGTRGSIPAPGPSTARYGGNTPSIEVRNEALGPERVTILDAGTGIRELGQRLVGQGAVDIDLLITHTHWDHIQGLPFFRPFFDPANAVRIWGAPQNGVALEAILRNQMSPVVFPVPLDGLAAALTVHHIGTEAFDIDGFHVRTMQVRHPGTTLAYSLTAAGATTQVVYVPDNELGPGGEYAVSSGWRDEFVAFIRDADVLIHDAMYTPEQLGRHRGWGHSSYDEAVQIAADAGVRRLVLFHHRPEHDDAAVDRIVEEAQTAADRCGGGVEVIAGREGLELTL